MKQHRNTKQRQVVLDAVMARHDHPSADEVYFDVRSHDNRISRGTVYRNLNNLAEDGEILKVRYPDLTHYDCRTDLHYHFRCTECGAVYDVPLEYDREADRNLENKTDHKVNRHYVTFEGTCENCQNRSENK